MTAARDMHQERLLCALAVCARAMVFVANLYLHVLSSNNFYGRFYRNEKLNNENCALKMCTKNKD